MTSHADGLPGHDGGRRLPWTAAAIPAILFVLLVSATAVVAANSLEYVEPIDAGLDAHLAAMLSIYALLVVAVGVLVRAAGGTGVAVLTLLGGLVAPLSIASPPIGWLEGAGATAWPYVVGALEAVLVGLGAWAWSQPRSPRSGSAVLTFGCWVVGFGAAWTVFAYVPGAIEDPGHGEIGAGMVEGWPLVIGGLFAAAAVASSWLHRALLVALPPLMVWSMYSAYTREGGWPGIPGWEQSPLWTTTTIAAVVVAAPVLGVVVGLVARALAGPLARAEAHRVAQPA